MNNLEHSIGSPKSRERSRIRARVASVKRGGRSRRSGMSFVELMVVTFVLGVAFMIFTSTVAGISRQRTINRDSVTASSEARNILEEMRNEDFGDVYALYNADPADDPGGAGTAPGKYFAVEGLDLEPGDPDGFVGEILFPTIEVTPGTFELREDAVDAELGMPRDLNGDSMIKTDDRSGDYFLLPVRIRIRWMGNGSPRQYEITSMLCEFNKE